SALLHRSGVGEAQQLEPLRAGLGPQPLEHRGRARPEGRPLGTDLGDEAQQATIGGGGHPPSSVSLALKPSDSLARANSRAAMRQDQADVDLVDAAARLEKIPSRVPRTLAHPHVLKL